ncbi:MAG TPA: nuclear transport factor 2 family protein [Candidatus Angelobacter sp.]
MNLIRSWLKIGLLFTIFVFAKSANPFVTSSQSPASASCAAPEYRHFDFWIGDWDVFESDKATPVAHVLVDRILGGCVLREDYQDTEGHKGQSFSIYDASRKVWHQSWVTNRGQLLIIEGQLHEGAMVLSGSDHTAQGQERLVRGNWKPVSSGVRESAVTSTDGGKTWSPWFDLLFRPAAKPQAGQNLSAAEEEKTIAALDTEYQSAVQKNDAATMDRLLADNFVLVTGTGKTYNKADLLDEARSGHLRYEHQEDSEQRVRIWGDTAIITARLRAKGTDNGKPFDYALWFSDTYIRTPAGWRYVFGQASRPLSDDAAERPARHSSMG